MDLLFVAMDGIKILNAGPIQVSTFDQTTTVLIYQTVYSLLPNAKKKLSKRKSNVKMDKA